MNIEIQPWIVPNFVLGVMPPGKRQDGFNPDSVPKWELKYVDAGVLAKQCDEFRREVFRKARKKDPAKE